MSLNDKQQDVVNCPGHVLVVACPGAGKTRCLEHKTQYLLQQNNHNKIIAVTFSKDGANEILNRIIDRVGKHNAKRLLVGTFHSLALRQIKHLQISKNIVQNHVKYKFINQVREAHNNNYHDNLSLEYTVKVIEHYKSTLNRLNDDDSVQSRLYYAYQEILTSHQLIDFHDIMILAVKEMMKGTISPYKASHMLVDEYQDTDDVQYRWVSAHALNTHITVVGDDDQTIYSWRYARGFEGMQLFEDEFQARCIILDTNYRCRTEILEHAHQLIMRNQHRVKKVLKSGKGPGGAINVHDYDNVNEELNGIVQHVAHQPNDWAILARTNSDLYNVEVKLKEHEIPYYRISGRSIWEADHIVVFFELLRSLIRRDNTGFTHALTWLGMTSDEIHTLKNQCNGHLLDGFIQNKGLYKGYTDKVKTDFAAMLTHITKWDTNIRADPTSAVVNVMDWVNTVKPKSKERLEKVKNMVNGMLESSDISLLQIIANLRNLRDNKERTGVALSTLHSSKGLEFKQVWITGLTEGSIPNDRTIEEAAEAGNALGGIEEERRLFYVGMTRAMEALHLSYYLHTTVKGKVLKNTPSRFLTDAGLPETNKINVELKSPSVEMNYA